MCHTTTPRQVVSLVLLAAILSGCPKGKDTSTPAPAAPGAAPRAAAPVDFKIERIDLGTAIDADNKITAATTRFKPTDIIYASVVGDGHAVRVTLRAQLFSNQGPLVADASQYVTPNGPTVAEFHLSYPNGWTTGKYKLQVSIDDTPAGSADLTIAD